MWLLRSLALALLAISIAGCSDGKTFNAEEVARVLRAHGFKVEVSDPEARLTAAIPGAAAQGRVPDGLSQTLIQFRDAHGASGPARLGGRLADLELEAFVFHRSGNATCDEPNVVGTCLEKRNVVIVVRAERAQAAREALDDL